MPLSKSEQGFIAACSLLTFNHTYPLIQFQKELTDSERSSTTHEMFENKVSKTHGKEVFLFLVIQRSQTPPVLQKN